MLFKKRKHKLEFPEYVPKKKIVKKHHDSKKSIKKTNDISLKREFKVLIKSVKHYQKVISNLEKDFDKIKNKKDDNVLKVNKFERKINQYNEYIKKLGETHNDLHGKLESLVSLVNEIKNVQEYMESDVQKIKAKILEHEEKIRDFVVRGP